MSNRNWADSEIIEIHKGCISNKSNKSYQGTDYLEFFKKHCVYDVNNQDVRYGWILSTGESIGFTAENDETAHIELAYECIAHYYPNINCKNPIQYLEDIGAIKFCDKYAITYNNPNSQIQRNKLTVKQETKFKEWLKIRNIQIIELGSSWQEEDKLLYSKYKINSMNSIMLFNNMSTIQ